MEITKSYRTIDGSLFTKKKDAAIHETGIQLMAEVINSSGLRNNGELKLICLELAKNYSKYIPVLTKIRHAQSIKS